MITHIRCKIFLAVSPPNAHFEALSQRYIQIDIVSMSVVVMTVDSVLLIRYDRLLILFSVYLTPCLSIQSVDLVSEVPTIAELPYTAPPM